MICSLLDKILSHILFQYFFPTYYKYIYIYIYLATLKTLNGEFELTNLSPLHFSIMQSPAFNFYFTLTLFLFLNASKAQNESPNKTIVVDQSGKGQFTTVQKAIDSIPSNNKQWTIIHLNAGVYK